MTIRLEYSPTLGELKQIPPQELRNHSLEFQTLCCYISSSKATQFQQRVVSKFPALNSPCTCNNPSLQEMKNELNLFMEESVLINEIPESVPVNP